MTHHGGGNPFTWHDETIWSVYQRTPEIGEGKEKVFRHNVFVFFAHVPAAFATLVNSRLELNSAKLITDVKRDNEIGVRDIDRSECSNQTAPKKLTHDEVLTGGTYQRYRGGHKKLSGRSLSYPSQLMPDCKPWA